MLLCLLSFTCNYVVYVRRFPIPMGDWDGLYYSDFIWPFLPPYNGVIPNSKMACIFPIFCILGIFFRYLCKIFPNGKEKVASQNPK